MKLLDINLDIFKKYGGLEKYQFLDDSMCVVVDGTEFYSSQNIKCFCPS